MKFSVIIPVYNVEEYLEECIESVLRQTHTDYEIVLVDDGSADRSGEICDLYCEKFPERIKTVHNKNQGRFASRICGLEYATGDAVWFVDSDDCIRKDALEILAGVFDLQSCDMVLFNGSRQPDYEKSWGKSDFSDTGVLIPKAEVCRKLVMGQIPNSLCLKAMKKNVALHMCGRTVPACVKNGEDLLLSTVAVDGAEKTAYIDENLYYYRQRQGSIVNSFNPQRHISVKAVHQLMEKYIDKWGMQELHSAHFSREVKGWVECLVPLLRNKKAVGREKLAACMKELAEDSYFRNAYEKMKPELLGRKEKLLAGWLYNKKFLYLNLIAIAIDAADRLRGMKK